MLILDKVHFFDRKSKTMLLQISYFPDVGLSSFLMILVTHLRKLILLYRLSSVFQKFVDFVGSSFVSPQNHIDHGNQMKGQHPFPN